MTKTRFEIEADVNSIIACCLIGEEGAGGEKIEREDDRMIRKNNTVFTSNCLKSVIKISNNSSALMDPSPKYRTKR